MKIKSESEISSHITLTSVISGLFHTCTAVVSTGTSKITTLKYLELFQGSCT